MDLGASYSQRGDTEAAIDQLEKAIELDPRDTEACMRLATLFSDRGEFDRSAAAYDRRYNEIRTTARRCMVCPT